MRRSSAVHEGGNDLTKGIPRRLLSVRIQERQEALVHKFLHFCDWEVVVVLALYTPKMVVPH